MTKIPSSPSMPSIRKNPAGKSHFSGDAAFRRGGEQLKLHWEVEDFRVRVAPENSYARLNEPERVELFSKILAKVRTRSEHPDGIYSAALAITQGGEMFVASNAQRQHEFHKDCAEINLINTITQLVGAKTKISRLVLMMGFSTPTKETPREALERPFAPCGKCMDTLFSCSTPEGMITMVPAQDGSLPVSLNMTAHHVEELGPGEAWHTRFSSLMIDKAVDMTREEQALAQQGWQALVDNEKPVEHLSEKEVKRLFISKRKLNEKETSLKALILQAASNIATGRKSEAELDIDHSAAGINRFMFKHIRSAYRKRSIVEGKTGERAVDMIRCVLIRLVDGSFHGQTEVEGPEENAVMHAGVTAVNATRDLHERITDVWIMRVSKKDIAEGKLYTSPKEELERLYKRRPMHDNVNDIQGKPITGDMNVHYIVFNDGALTPAQVEAITHRYLLTELFTSRFKGSRHYGHNGNADTSQTR